MMNSLSSQLLKTHPIQIGQPSAGEQLALELKRRIIDNLIILKTMIPVSEIAISRLSTGYNEEAKLYSLSELRYIYENVRDMHVLSLILRNHPYLSFIDEGTVENIRKETRKLIGTTLPTLRAEIVTVKKDAKTYERISKQFKDLEQAISSLDLWLVGYSGDEAE